MDSTEFFEIIDSGEEERFFEDFSPMESTLRAKYGSVELLMTLDQMVDLPEELRVTAFKQLVAELRKIKPHNTSGI